jgi:hypothetical protein
MQAGLEDEQELARWSGTLAQALQLGQETVARQAMTGGQLLPPICESQSDAKNWPRRREPPS